MTVGAAEMASQPLLRCHLSSTTVSPRITRFSTVFPCPRLHSGANLFLSGFSKQPFCPRVSLEGVLRGKRRFQLLVKSVAGLNSGVSDIGTNGSWRRAVRDANLGQAIIPPPPEPPKDGSLPQVRGIHIHFCDDSIVTSSERFRMTTLEELDLSRCSKITDAGIGHLLSLPSLKKLSLSETGIKADGVARLSVITSLTSLDLGGLPVSNSAVSSLQTLTQLQFLDMWGSKITNEGTALLKAFVHLNFLNLAWTNVTRVPELFSLTSLNMSKCTIDSIFEGLAKQKTSLLRLHFAGAIFTDAYHVFSCLGTHNLNFLDLSGSPLDDVSFLAAMNRLEFLDLSSTGVTDSSVKSVADIGANLKQLNLSNTRISSDAIAILAGNVPKLECISLSHTVVGDNVLTYLSRMPALRSISLSHTNIKGFIYVGECDSNPTFSLVALQQLEYLEILDLENTHVSDLACKPLSFLKELCHLSLRSDFLSDISLHTVSSLPTLLQILDLRDCWLLAEDGIVEFCQAHPRLELRHELITGISKDQAHFSRGQMHSHATVEASRGRRGRKLGTSSSSLTTRENSTQRRFVDERIKYSTSELLHIQASPRSALSLLDIGISLPASLERK